MNMWEQKYVGPLMHDRIIGALELCCRLGEMLVIQNKRVDWDTHTIGGSGECSRPSREATMRDGVSHLTETAFFSTACEEGHEDDSLVTGVSCSR